MIHNWILLDHVQNYIISDTSSSNVSKSKGLKMKKYFLTSQTGCLLSLFANRFLKISFETLAQQESKYLDVVYKKVL